VVVLEKELQWWRFLEERNLEFADVERKRRKRRSKRVVVSEEEEEEEEVFIVSKGKGEGRDAERLIRI
jgi:hypothetical protein